MTRSRIIGAATALLLAAVGSAQEEEPQPGTPPERPESVLQLLEFIREEAREGTRRNRERIERFRDARDERQRMLDEVSRELAAENDLSDDLDRQYEQNETDLAELEERLRIRIGNFGELFGVVRDVAGDSVGEVLNSLASAQYPDRAADARAMVEAWAIRSSASASSA